MDKTRPKQKAQRHLHLIAKSTALFLFEISYFYNIYRHDSSPFNQFQIIIFLFNS